MTNKPLSPSVEDFTNRLYERAGAQWLEANSEKPTIMVNRTTNIRANLTINGEKLEEVSSFKYVGATLFKNSTRTA
ncbi:hypothetical protein DPMN_041780 [Dreissena polymorpha]|uniref:Uncharacterized protein n=1 Tax=Dreissena polymorpha TaxID=45954 RepID=A0A9D4CYG2_DREPO|nr:hypothetical protein DPMN_041780 [Dreissena polymorpha]